MPPVSRPQPNVSIDYALMEKADQVGVVPCDIGWSDIGSWKSVSEVHAADEQGNCAVGPAFLMGSRNTFVRAQDRFVAAIGVQDLVVIDTPDALLVAHKDASQQVKDVVTHLKRSDVALAIDHATVHRPWGTFTVLVEGDGFKVKRIMVKPTASLSLQLHHRRSEHWVVIAGVAHVTRGEEKRLICIRTSQPISRSECVTGSPTGARRRWKSSKCSAAATSARTISSGFRTRTGA